MGNNERYGTKLERTVVETISNRLPAGWVITIGQKSEETLLTLKASDSRKAILKVISRKNMTPRDIANLVQGEASQIILVAPFLSPRTRDLIVQAGASYADAAGNLRLVVKNPAVFLENNVQDKNPQSGIPRTLRSLKGATAGRVIRALCDFLPPYGVRTLAEHAAIPLGTVSRVISFLEEEALLTRDSKKQIVAVDWQALITRWARDYNVMTSNVLGSYLEPRGLSALASKLLKLDCYAVTGSLAGAGIAPARLAMIYVEDAQAAARNLELTETDTGANVWLLEPYDKVVFERTQSIIFGLIKVTAVAPSQVAVDLLTSPGRGPQEAQVLIEQMKGNEHVWRKS